jgi:hypothetical protein
LKDYEEGYSKSESAKIVEEVRKAYQTQEGCRNTETIEEEHTTSGENISKLNPGAFQG